MYRRQYFILRHQNSVLIKANRRLKRKLEAQEDFLFGPILDGFL